jgi:6-phosphogluconolactonase
MTERTLIVQPDPAAVAHHVADWILKEATEAEGVVAVALSGGSTPKALYELLAEPPYLTRLPWSRIHWFWGDERFVPPSDPLSNYRMVWEAMLKHAPIPPGNIHPVPTEGLTPEGAADAYDATLKIFHGANRLDPAHPLFDINLLGLGEDGHTASLFPGTDVLRERTRWVSAVIGAKAEARITLTYPALDSSRYAAFLIVGAGKQEMLGRLMAGDTALPAAEVAPVGELLVFADEAAAG